LLLFQGNSTGFGSENITDITPRGFGSSAANRILSTALDTEDDDAAIIDSGVLGAGNNESGFVDTPILGDAKPIGGKILIHETLVQLLTPRLGRR
jgi:hypothetical protein